MNVLLTLDYELFLGQRTGTVSNCLLRPMNEIANVCRSEGGVKTTLFVDASYLYRLSQYLEIYPELKVEYNQIENHLKELQVDGHDIQLHVHPHWATSTFNGSEWNLDHERYKLCDMSEEVAMRLFINSKNILDSMLIKPTKAFRAGGFSAQPTSLLATLFEKTGIKIDCSVCPGMKYNSPQQRYDYRMSPVKGLYRFQEDICKENPDGTFVEIPITTIRVSPLFNWKYAFTRVLKKSKHQLMGDGCGVKAAKDSIYERLFHRAICIVTMDGFKSSLLSQQYERFKRANLDTLCVIGHPKLTTPYSLEKLRQFIEMVHANDDRFLTISQLIEE